MGKSIASWAIGLAVAAPAQTYVVDAAGGGHFTSLQTAIDAVPSGATLHVKSGSYSGFAIQGKSLTIVAEVAGGPNVTYPGSVTLSGLAPGQRVCISGLTLNG